MNTSFPNEIIKTFLSQKWAIHVDFKHRATAPTYQAC